MTHILVIHVARKKKATTKTDDIQDIVITLEAVGQKHLV
jgi:hypothetical protein